MTDSELLPCPFCGSYDVSITQDDEKDYYFVECGDSDCYTYGPIALTEDGAIEKWNMRQSPPASIDVNQNMGDVTGTVIGLRIGSIK